MLEKIEALKGPGLLVLGWLCGRPEGERATAPQVGEALGLSAAAAWRVLKRLAGAGWVLRMAEEKTGGVGAWRLVYWPSDPALRWWRMSQEVLRDASR